MKRELEWKYSASPITLAAIIEAFSGAFRTIEMETTYYDTPGRDLASRQWTLRHRLENGTGICTLKLPESDGSRREYETPAKTLIQGVLQLLEQGAPEELREWTRAAAPVCGAVFTRQARTLEVNGSTVELALDHGVLQGGRQELPFAEVEVELLSGDDMVARAFAAGLSARFGLQEQPLSKFARAFQMAGGI